MERNQHRVCAHVQTVCSSSRKSDELYPVSEFTRHLDIDVVDSGYALAIPRFRIDELPECQRRKNGDLVCDIKCFNIVRRIRLRESQLLSFGKRSSKAAA